MRFGLLGPLTITNDEGRSVEIRGRKTRLLAATLLCRANQPVAVEALVDALWGLAPPRQAGGSLRVYVHHLRQALGESRIDRRSEGYRLLVRPDELDVDQFRTLVAMGRDAMSLQDPAKASELFRAALALWRGPALAGFNGVDALAMEGYSLEELRLDALEQRFEAELTLGWHSEISVELRALSKQHPFRETIQVQLMRALHGAGRTAEALQKYDDWRKWLAEELGADPGPETEQLHMAILLGEPTLAGRARTSRQMSAPSAADQGVAAFGPEAATLEATRPHTLPPDIIDYTGRAEDIVELRYLLTEDGAQAGPIVSVVGPGGIGKTALAVHVAHGVRESFPDGQLYIDLRGTDPAGPAEPAEVLGRFLRALGVDGAAIPVALDERIELYRHLLAGRRVLVVLDNAATDDQTLALIPGRPGCAVLMTGRPRVGATLGAHTLKLDVLTDDDALRLLQRIAGQARVAAAPDAAMDLCNLCGRLPLALRIAAAKLAAKPHWPITKVVSLLADECRRLDQLTMGNLDVRATISLSYDGLDADVRRLLCMLGGLNLPDVSVWHAAALLDASLDDAEELLEELFDAQLVDVVGVDGAGYPKYQMHDLVQLFARERTTLDGYSTELAAAHGRLYRALLYAADSAHREMHGGDHHQITGSTPRWTFAEPVVRRLVATPLRWFELERHSIIAAIRLAADERDDTACWELVNATSSFFETRRHFGEWQEILRLGLAAAVRLGDARGEAAMRFWAACAYGDSTEYECAVESLSTALELFESCEDSRGRAMALAYMGIMKRFQGHYDAALQLYHEALPILRHLADPVAEAWVLRNIGQVQLQQSHYDSAESYLDRAGLLCRQAGSRQAEAQVLFWHGMLCLKQGRYPEADVKLRQALAICRSLEDRGGEAQCLRGLGLASQRRGDPSDAMTLFSQALQIVHQPRKTFMETEIRRSMSELASTPN